MNITTKQILTGSIQIESKDIFRNRNIDGLILHKLKGNEGKCVKNGYVTIDSTELLSKSDGRVRNIGNQSYIEYEITYKIESILPNKGTVYQCTINNITKMGLICYIEYGEFKDIESSPLLIIIPKEYCDIEKEKEGSKITIETLDKRIKYMSPQIQLIGKKI